MNDEDREWEINNLEISPFSLEMISIEQNDSLPIETDPFLQPNHLEEEMQVNFTSGEASCCLDSIVSHQDLQSARHSQNSAK